MQNFETKPNDNIHSERRVILDLQSSLIDIWNQYKIPEFYHNLFINYIKALSNSETEIVIKEEMKAIVNGSCYIQAFEKCQEDRHKIQQFLKVTIEQDRERRSEEGLSMVCQYVSRLRDINYKSSYYLDKIRGKFQQEIPIHKSAEKYYYNKFAISIDCFRKELLKSYMSRYVVWDQEYDPFYIGIKERIKHPSRKVNESISDLFDFSIDQSYKFLKMRKILITWLYMDPKKKNSNTDKILSNVGLPQLKNSRYTNYEDIKKEIMRYKSKDLHRKQYPIRIIPSPNQLKNQSLDSYHDRDLFKTRYRKNKISPYRDQPNYIDQPFNFDRIQNKPELDSYQSTPDHQQRDQHVRASQDRKFQEHFGINKSTIQLQNHRRRLSNDAGKIKRGRNLFNSKNDSVGQIPVDHSPNSMPNRSNSMNARQYEPYPRRLNSLQNDYQHSPIKQSVSIQTDMSEAIKKNNYRMLQKKLMISIQIKPNQAKNRQREKEDKERTYKTENGKKNDQADEKLASKRSGNPFIKNTQVQINYQKKPSSSSKQNEPMREERKPTQQTTDRAQNIQPERYENEQKRTQPKDEQKEPVSSNKTNKASNPPIKRQPKQEPQEQYQQPSRKTAQENQNNPQSSEPKQLKSNSNTNENNNNPRSSQPKQVKSNSNVSENNNQSTPISNKQQKPKEQSSSTPISNKQQPNELNSSNRQDQPPKTSATIPKSQTAEPTTSKAKPSPPAQQQPAKVSNTKQQPASTANQTNPKQTKKSSQQSQNPTTTNNDPKQPNSKVKQTSEVKSSNLSKDEKRQIKMRVGKQTYDNFKDYLYSYEFNPDYIKLYDMKRVIKEAQFSQTYLTEYLVNNQPAAIALCGLTPPNNAMVIRFWAMAKGYDSTLSTMLFKKYVDYVEKSITSENVFYKGEELQQLKACGFELKKDKLYGRKRTTQPREIDSEFKSFLYIECSHIKFVQKQKEDLLFSSQIERFNAKNSFSANYLFTMKKSEFEDPQKMIKVNEKLPNFAAVNKILTKEDFDNYQVTQKINPQSIDLLRFYLSSEFRNLFVGGDGLFKFYGSEVYNQQGKVIYSIKTSKGNGRLCFGKGYKQVDEFIGNLKEETAKKVVFTVPMFNKKLYGRYGKITENQIGFYGNWQIGLVWEDEMQGRLKYSVQSCLAFGDSNFYMSIQLEKELVYAIEVNKDDYIF